MTDDSRAEIRKILASMKANGVTIQVKSAAGHEDTIGDRPFGVIDEEARNLGMTYGDDDE